MRIRPLTDSDIPAVAALLRSLSDEYIVNECSVEAAATFRRENDVDGIGQLVKSGMVYYVADKDGAIAGFIGMRDNRHLFHMFVDKAYHRQGIASALWTVARRAALAAGNPGTFTVNASNFALPVYTAMGFIPTSPVQYRNGIYFNPMQLDGVTA